MKKPAFCTCKDKDADQLRVNHAADQGLCFCHIINTNYNPSTFQIGNFKPLAIFCGCTARFVSDLVGNPEDRLSHDIAQNVFQDHKEYSSWEFSHAGPHEEGSEWDQTDTDEGTAEKTNKNTKTSDSNHTKSDTHRSRPTDT